MQNKWKPITSGEFNKIIQKGKIHEFLGDKFKATEIKLDGKEYKLGSTNDKKDLIKLFKAWAKNKPSQYAFSEKLKTQLNKANPNIKNSAKLTNLRKQIIEEVHPSTHEVSEYLKSKDIPKMDPESSHSVSINLQTEKDKQEYIKHILSERSANFSRISGSEAGQNAQASSINPNSPKTSIGEATRISANTEGNNTSAIKAGSGFVRPRL